MGHPDMTEARVATSSCGSVPEKVIAFDIQMCNVWTMSGVL